MAPQYEAQAPIYSFSGLYIAANPELAPDDSLQQCHNFNLGLNGELVKRPIRCLLGTTAPTVITNILGQANGFDSNAVLVLGNDGFVYRAPFDFASFSKVTSIPQTNGYNSVQYLSKLYVPCIDGIYEWAGGTTAVKLTGSPAAATSILLFQERLFAIKDSRLYYSAPGNPNDWTTVDVAGFIAVADGDGDNLTAMVLIGDKILLFKNTSIHILYTADSPNDWTVRAVSPERGCVGPKAVANVRGIIYFIDRDGLWITDGVAFSRISDPITPVFLGPGRYRGTNFYDTVSVYKDHLVLKIDSTTKWNAASLYSVFFYRYSGDVKGFTSASEFMPGDSNYPDTAPGFSSVFLIRPSTAADPYYVVPRDNRVDKLIDTADQIVSPQETVKCYFRTKSMTFGQPTRYKRVRYGNITIFGEPLTTQSPYANLKYYYVTDNFQGDLQQLWQEGLSGTRNWKIKGAGFGRSHSFYFEEASSCANLQILGVNFIHQLARQQDRMNV